MDRDFIKDIEKEYLSRKPIKNIGLSEEKYLGSQMDSDPDLFQRLLKVYAVLNLSRKFESVKDLFLDSCSLEISGSPTKIPYAGLFSGINPVKKFFRVYKDSVEDVLLTLRYYVQDNLSINVHLIEEGTAKNTKKKYRMETMDAWRFGQNKKIIAMRRYTDTYSLANAFSPDFSPSVSIYDLDYQILPLGYPSIDVVERVNLWYKALSGQEGSILDFIDDETITILPGAKYITPFAGQYKGIDAFLRFATVLFKTESLDSFEINPIEKKYVVDKFIVNDEFTEKVTAYWNNKTFSSKGAHSFILSDTGKFRVWRSYNDTYEFANAFS